MHLVKLILLDNSKIIKLTDWLDFDECHSTASGDQQQVIRMGESSPAILPTKNATYFFITKPHTHAMPMRIVGHPAQG